MPNKLLLKKRKSTSIKPPKKVIRYDKYTANRPSTTFDSFSQDSTNEDDDIVKELALKKAESLSLPVGIREPSELKWYYHHDDEDGTKRYFPCRLCDASEAIYVNLEPLWDPNEVSLIQVLEYPPTKPFKGGKDRILADLSSLKPYNNNSSETVWDKKIYKKYTKQRRQQKRKGSITVSESDAMAGYIFLNRILKAALTYLDKSDDAFQTVENDSENDGDSWMETPYELAHDAPNMFPQETFDKKTEPLRPGDVIRYFSPIYCAGDSRGKRVATVLSTNPSSSYMIRLDNNEILPNETLIKRVQVVKDGKLYPHDGLNRPVDSFKLKKRELIQQNAKTVLEAQAKAVGNIVNRHVEDMQQMMTKEGLPMDLVNGLKSRREIAEQQNKGEKQNMRSRYFQNRKESSFSFGSESESNIKRTLQKVQKRARSKSLPQKNFDPTVSSTSDEEFESGATPRKGKSLAKAIYHSSDEDSFHQSFMSRDASSDFDPITKGEFSSIPGDVNQNPGETLHITKYSQLKKTTAMQRMKDINPNFSSNDDSFNLKAPCVKIPVSHVVKSLRAEANPASKTILTTQSPLAAASVSKWPTGSSRQIQNKRNCSRHQDCIGTHETTQNHHLTSDDDKSYVDLNLGIKTEKTSDPSDSESSMENHGLCLRRHGKRRKLNEANATVSENLVPSSNDVSHDIYKLGSVGKNAMQSHKTPFCINDKNKESDGYSSAEDFQAYLPKGGSDERSTQRKKALKRKPSNQISRVQSKSKFENKEEDAAKKRTCHESFSTARPKSLGTSITLAPSDDATSGQIADSWVPLRSQDKKVSNRHLARIKRKRCYVVEEDDELEDSSEGSRRYMHARLSRGSYPSIVTSIKKKNKSPNFIKKTTLTISFEEHKNSECKNSFSGVKTSASTNASLENESIISPLQSSVSHPRSADRKAKKQKKVYGRGVKNMFKNPIMPHFISTAEQVETSQLESNQG